MCISSSDYTLQSSALLQPMTHPHFVQMRWQALLRLCCTSTLAAHLLFGLTTTSTFKPGNAHRYVDHSSCRERASKQTTTANCTIFLWVSL